MQGQRLLWSELDLKRPKERALRAQCKCQLNINYRCAAGLMEGCSGSVQSQEGHPGIQEYGFKQSLGSLGVAFSTALPVSGEVLLLLKFAHFIYSSESSL